MATLKPSTSLHALCYRCPETKQARTIAGAGISVFGLADFCLSSSA
jgi:hypothetical protein